MAQWVQVPAAQLAQIQASAHHIHNDHQVMFTPILSTCLPIFSTSNLPCSVKECVLACCCAPTQAIQQVSSIVSGSHSSDMACATGQAALSDMGIPSRDCMDWHCWLYCMGCQLRLSYLQSPAGNAHSRDRPPAASMYPRIICLTEHTYMRLTYASIHSYALTNISSRTAAQMRWPATHIASHHHKLHTCASSGLLQEGESAGSGLLVLAAPAPPPFDDANLDPGGC